MLKAWWYFHILLAAKRFSTRSITLVDLLTCHAFEIRRLALRALRIPCTKVLHTEEIDCLSLMHLYRTSLYQSCIGSFNPTVRCRQSAPWIHCSLHRRMHPTTPPMPFYRMRGFCSPKRKTSSKLWPRIACPLLLLNVRIKCDRT